MKPFSISDIYLNKKNQSVIDINPLPENYCSFDCVFCPIGRTKVKTDKPQSFKETEEFLERLEEVLEDNSIDLVFINPDGELFAQNRITEILHIIKRHDAKVRIISNGYLFNRAENRPVLNACDEVIGELAVTTEDDFQKLQRPLPGYTLSDLVSNMARFNSQYQGKFILDITILKKYSDSDEDIERFKRFIRKISPDELDVHTPATGKLQSAFGINCVRLKEITDKLDTAITTRE